MEKVTMKLNRMGIPVPEIARGVNPHETIRESMLTLEGPVVTDDVALAGNHRLVILNPVGGAPAFYPLAGHATTDPEETGADGLIAFLDSVCPGHTYENNPAGPSTETEPVSEDPSSAKTNWFEALPKDKQIYNPVAAATVQISSANLNYKWEMSEDGSTNWVDFDPATYADAYSLRLAENTGALIDEPASQAKTEWFDALSVITEITSAAGTSAPITSADLNYAWEMSSDGTEWVDFNPATYTNESLRIKTQTVIVPGPDNAEASLTERFNWLFDRLFIVRAGSEFAEMPIVDPVMYEEYEGLDAANDTCVRLHKGIISNLAVLGLTNNPNLATYVYNVKPGECAAIFVSEDGTEVELAPASFGHTPTDASDTYTGPFSGWTKIALPSVVVNKAEVKTRVTEKSSETYVCIDITCC